MGGARQETFKALKLQDKYSIFKLDGRNESPRPSRFHAKSASSRPVSGNLRNGNKAKPACFETLIFCADRLAFGEFEKDG